MRGCSDREGVLPEGGELCPGLRPIESGIEQAKFIKGRHNESIQFVDRLGQLGEIACGSGPSIVANLGGLDLFKPFVKVLVGTTSEIESRLVAQFSE